MDKILKFLKKRSPTERERLIFVVRAITENKLEGMDVKKLKGFDSVFRVRVGNFRIIFEKTGKENWVRSIAKRDGRTYGRG